MPGCSVSTVFATARAKVLSAVTTNAAIRRCRTTDDKLCANPVTPAASSVAVGSDVRAKVTYCTDETEANNVLLAHRDSGLAAGIDYIVHSPVCRVAVLRFTVLRELAAYADLPLERGQPARTFYVIEAVDALGERLYIVSMVKVTERYAGI